MMYSDEMKSEIYRGYYGKVYGCILNKINDAGTAEDICGDVFVKVYEKIDSFDESRSSLSTWIYTITKRTLIDYYRTRRVSEEIPEQLNSHDDVEDDVCNAEMLEILSNALSRLDANKRDVIIFHYYHEMSFKDISEKMNFSYSYIKYLHSGALSEIKKYFNL